MPIATSQDTTTGRVSSMKEMMIDLYNFNIKNNYMYNGNILVRGSNRFKVGHRLQYSSAEDKSVMTYYIRSVTHNFVNFGNWATELGVTRGLPEKDRFTAPYNKYEEYTGMGWAPAAPQDNKPAKSGGTTKTAPPINGNTARAVVADARTYVAQGDKEIMYVMGGTNPYTMPYHLDCAGFVNKVYEDSAGITLGQAMLYDVDKGEFHAGTPISMDQLQPGDLVIFQRTYDVTGTSHVGIYTGNGKFIHNSSSKGTVVEADLHDG